MCADPLAAGGGLTIIPTTMTATSTLPELVPILHRQQGFSEVLAALHKGAAATIDGAWGSACALTAAVLAKDVPGTLVVVLPRLSEMDEFASDLAGFLGMTASLFPGWEALPRETDAKSAREKQPGRSQQPGC
jgi:transcription-repair coupling factor (superfamily II helicase)